MLKLAEFENFAEKINKIVGSPLWFLFSLLLIALWIPSGVLFGWGDTWQLIINTTTTILTFLMVSLLQTSQNRWERKMDADQEKEKHNLKVVLEEIKRLESKIDSKTSSPVIPHLMRDPVANDLTQANTPS